MQVTTVATAVRDALDRIDDHSNVFITTTAGETFLVKVRRIEKERS